MVLSCVLLAVTAPFPAAPARAGSNLIAGDPADGAALATAPGAVTLTFAAPPDVGRSHVTAVDGAGTRVDAAEATRVGQAGLRLPVSIHSPGDYTVAYHAVLTDGSEAAGLLRFSVGTGVPPAGPARAAPAVPPVHQHTIDPVSAALLVLDLAVLIAVVLLLGRRPGPT